MADEEFAVVVRETRRFARRKPGSPQTPALDNEFTAPNMDGVRALTNFGARRQLLRRSRRNAIGRASADLRTPMIFLIDIRANRTTRNALKGRGNVFSTRQFSGRAQLGLESVIPKTGDSSSLYVRMVRSTKGELVTA